MGTWVAQTGRFEAEFRFAAELGLALILAFDVDEPWRCRGAEGQAEGGAKVSERSEFFAPRDCYDKRASTAGHPAKRDTDTGGRLFAYFLALKSKAHQLTQ